MTAVAPPIAFNKIATAMGFSPSAKANLAEVYRIAEYFNAELCVLHVGEWTNQCDVTYHKFLKELNIPLDRIQLHTANGDPKVVLLDLCNKVNADLLVIGALARENIFGVFNTSIARELCRNAKLSLMLLTQSSVEARICDRIVVNGLEHPKTLDTIKTAVHMADKLGSTELYVVDELPEKQLIKPEDDKSRLRRNRKRKQLERQHHERLEQLFTKMQLPGQLEIKEKHVFGRRGYTIAHFARAVKADLLIVNSPDTKLGFLDRIFKHDLEYILMDLPANLLIVHTTKSMMNAAS